MRRAGLISVDWHRNIIKREKPLKEYIEKNVMASDMWPTVVEDWCRINAIILGKRGSVNADYQEPLLLHQNK